MQAAQLCSLGKNHSTLEKRHILIYFIVCSRVKVAVMLYGVLALFDEGGSHCFW